VLLHVLLEEHRCGVAERRRDLLLRDCKLCQHDAEAWLR
jgi:hypothetical protein